MGQFTKDGVIYEELPDGNARVIGHVPSGPRVQKIGGPDPLAVNRDNRAAAAADRAASASEAATTLAQKKFIADLYEKGLQPGPNGTPVPIPGWTPPTSIANRPILTAKERADAIAGYKSAEQLDQAIADMERLYQVGPGSTSGLAGVQDFLPSEANKNFDAAGNAARGIVGQALGFTGGQLNTATEANMAVGPYLPQSGNYDETILEKIARLKQLSQTARDRSIAILGGVPDANGQVKPVGSKQTDQKRSEQPPAAFLTGGSSSPPSGPQRSSVVDLSGQGGDGGMTLAQGDTRTENDPTLAGVNDRVRQMIDKGMSANQIASYLQSIGAGDRAGFNPVLPALQGAVDWKRRHPNTPYTGAVNVDDRLVPMSGARQMMNAVGQSPLGAYGINAADALTLGNLDSLTSNPELTRLGMAGVSAANPKSAFAGQATGATLGTLMTGGALGTAGRALGATGKLGQIVSNPLAADAVYGAGYGAGNNDQNRLLGAIAGATLGVLGNKAGQGIAKGLGSAVSGVTNPVANRLNAAGIPLTLGQAVSQSGRLGALVKGAEDKFSSIPVVGDLIKARRTEGLKAYNQAEFNRGLAPIDGSVSATGPAGVDQAFEATGNAYRSATAGVDIPLDQQFAADLGAAMQTGRNLPGSMGEEFGYTMNNRVRPELDSGNITGESYQAIMQGLNRDKAAFSGQPRGYDFGQAVSGVQDATKGLMQRGGGADVVSSLQKADAAYRNAKILQDAVNRARNGSRSGEVNIFTPSHVLDAAAASGRRFGGSQGTSRMPFRGLAEDAQAVLPSQVPDSGTAGRLAAMVLPGALAGGAASQGWLDPETAALLASLTLPSTKLGSAAIRKGLFGGATRKAFGSAIKQQAPALGQITSPLALTYFGQ